MGERSIMPPRSKQTYTKEEEIRAYESSINRKIKELNKMQENKVKFQHQQGLKEEIYRLRRQLAKVKDAK
jgi:polyhydroxyalkanoate synthesis regulator phasin